MERRILEIEIINYFANVITLIFKSEFRIVDCLYTKLYYFFSLTRGHITSW